MEKSSLKKSAISTPHSYLTFSENQAFRLELVSSLSTESKQGTMPNYLERRYCSYMANPSIISCRAYDDSVSFTLDLLFPTFEENKSFKIINHEFESLDIGDIKLNKIIYDKHTMNKNELRFFLVTVKLKAKISLDPQLGNFAFLQTGEEIYSLFMNDQKLHLK